MTVSEFRKVMLSSGGISEVECMNTLDRLFERLESNRCEYHDGEKVNMEDVNKAYVDESDHIRYQEWEELENVKIPVKTLLMAVMHTVHGRPSEGDLPFVQRVSDDDVIEWLGMNRRR